MTSAERGEGPRESQTDASNYYRLLPLSMVFQLAGASDDGRERKPDDQSIIC
jgi:hypothetical protein